jgi:hypothetical protein
VLDGDPGFGGAAAGFDPVILGVEVAVLGAAGGAGGLVQVEA